MQRLKTFLGLLTAVAVTALGVQAQDEVSQFRAPVDQDAPAGVATKTVKTETVKTETVTQNITAPRALTLMSDYKPGEATTTTQPHKKAPARKVSSTSELAGTYVLTATSLLTTAYNGCSVTIEASGTDSIAINDFWDPQYSTVVKGKVDITTGTISFPSCVMGQHSDYGDILFAKANTSTGQPIEDEEVTATIGEDGTISFNDPWGAYAKSSSDDTSWGYFAIVNGTILEPCNATFTGQSHYSSTPETYGVIFTQTGENVATIKNLGNYGQTVTITLKYDKTASIPSSLIAYSSTYGDYYSYNLTFDSSGSATATSDAAVTTVATDNRTLSWTNWGIVTGNTTGTRYIVAGYDSCVITTTTDFNYPDPLSVTEWEGEGTEASPYLIKVRDDLILLSEKVAEITEYDCTTPPSTYTYCRPFLGTYFKVVNDIDMSNYNFTPIGADWNHLFAGNFDGDGHTISNLNVIVSGSYAGLFGRTDTVSVIKNIKLDNAAVTAAGGYAAALAGFALGKIENVTVTGSTISGGNYCVGAVAGIGSGLTDITVTDCEITGTAGYTGGIVGEALGPVVNCTATSVTITSATSVSYTPGLPVGGVAGNLYLTSMENCYFSGTIDASSASSYYQSVGGLVGWSYGSTIKNSFAVGTIESCYLGTVAGGLVGFLRGDVENCYFNGRVYNPDSRDTGGAVGRLSYYTSGDDTLQPSLKNVYATATVSANTSNYKTQDNEQNNEIIGTIISGTTPTITNVYFDKQLENITLSQYGVTTSELISAQGPDGFDASVWSFSGTTYPALKTFENTAASNLSTIAVVLPTGASFDSFHKEATINKDSESEVAFYKNGTLSNTGYYATIVDDKITLNTEHLFGSDTIYYTNTTAGASYYRIAKIAPVPYDGSGLEDDPYLIKTKEDLVKLSQYTTVSNQLFPDTYFKIVNDIDLELDTTFLGICTAADDSNNSFAGTIDGGRHTIHRMKFDNVVWSSQPETGWGTIKTSDSESYKGFVGRLYDTGVVKNLNIGSDSELQFFGYSGAVVGYNCGLVDSCRNYADVTGYSSVIGGVVGQNRKDGKITNCYNEGNVTSGYAFAGGITGSSYSLIQNCMNVGRIEVRQLSTNFTAYLYSAGGIVGSSLWGGKYVNCVNAGTISAQKKRAGGIIGEWDAVSATTKLSDYTNDMNNVINYGTVINAGQTSMGAIAGGETQSASEDISGVYWDVQLLDIPADCEAEHDGMNGVETSVLTSGTVLAGFDTDVWQFEAGKYPILKQFADETKVQQAALVQLTIPTGVTTKNLSADAVITAGTPSLAQATVFTLDGNTLKGIPTTNTVVYDTLTIESEGFVKIIPLSAMPVVPLEGSGTEEDPYRISNAQEWNAFATFVSSTANDMTGTYVAVTGEIDFTNVSAGITPIGIGTAFNGFLDGNNHTVSGYAFKNTAIGQGALFGTIGADAVVSNLTAAGTAATTNLGYVAGVVGKLYGKLKNVTNTGNVTGASTHIAGVAAYVYQGAVLDSVTNTGAVTSSAAYVGGIAAYVYDSATFDNCVNKGNISTTKASTKADYVGGIAAYAQPATFNYCVNDGNISGSGSAGIVAYCIGKSGGLTYTFNECVNNGEVSGNAYIGGITAAQGGTAGNNVCNYVRCVNNGDITATSTSSVSSTGVTGIAAVYGAGSTFDHCVNNGNISGGNVIFAAGITGFYKGTPTATYPVTLRGCVNYGNVTSQVQQIAGIIACVTNYTTIDSCYNYGDIEQGLWGAAGICYAFNGDNSVLTNCVNFGDVTVAQYSAGGIIGNNTYTGTTLEGCVNLGDISTTSTDDSKNYGVGGIAGISYASFTDCFNAGKVSGKVRVGGIVGSPSYNASTARTRLNNCINIGEVVADEGCGGPLVGTVAGSESTYWGANNTCTNSYYLTDQSWRGTGATVGDYVAVGTGFSVAQLTGLDQGSSWFTADGYSFPVPAFVKDNADVLTHAAAVVLATEDTYDNVTNYKFNVGNPDGTAWTPSSSIVVINGNDAQVTEVSQIEVTLTNKTTSDSQQAPGTKAYSGADGVDWILKLNVNEAGIDDNTLGKVVAQEAYYTVSGVLVEKPEASDGQVYIVVRKYTDGTMNAIKIRN